MTQNELGETGQSTTVTIENYDDCRRAGVQTANELYKQFTDGEGETFELTVRPIETDTEQA